MRAEDLIRALGDVGDDLIQLAQSKKTVSPWKKWVSLAACTVLVISLGMLTLPYFPMGCGASSEEPQAPDLQADMEYVVSESEAEEAPMESPVEDKETGSGVTEGAVEASMEAQVRLAVETDDTQWLLETFVKPRTEGNWTLEKATYADDLLCLWLLPPEEEQVSGAVSNQWIMTVWVKDDRWAYREFDSAG